MTFTSTDPQARQRGSDWRSFLHRNIASNRASDWDISGGLITSLAWPCWANESRTFCKPTISSKASAGRTRLH